MQIYGLEFDHLGLATRYPDRAAAFLAGLGYRREETVWDPIQRTNLALCHRPGMPCIELISPVGDPGPLNGALSSGDGMVYHVCYRTDDAEASIDAIKRSGNRIVQIAAPQPAVLFGHRSVSFHMIKGFGLIEIIHGRRE